MSDVRDSSRSGDSPSTIQSRPDLEQKKKLAKELLRAFRRGDQEAIARARRHLPRLAEDAADSGAKAGAAGPAGGSGPDAAAAPPQETKGGRLSPGSEGPAPASQPLVLAEAQFVIARESGFASWPRMKHAIEALVADEETLVERITEAALAGRDKQVRDLISAAAGPRRESSGASSAEGSLLDEFTKVVGFERGGRSALMTRRVQSVSRSIYASAALGDDQAVLRLLRERPELARQEGGPRGWTPAFYACHSRFRRLDLEVAERRIRILEKLLEVGADPAQTVDAPEVPDGFRSLLTGAVECVSSPQLVELLLEAGAKRQENWALWAAAELRGCVGGDDLACLRVLLRDRPPQYQLDFALSLRVAMDEPGGVKLLLEAGANPDAGSWGAHGSVLHQAIRDERSLQVIKLLLDSGADAERPNRDGYRPYQIAVRLGRDEVAGPLADSGASTQLEPVDRLLSAALRSAVEGKAKAKRAVDQPPQGTADQKTDRPDQQARLRGQERQAGREAEDQTIKPSQGKSGMAKEQPLSGRESARRGASTADGSVRFCRTDHQMLAWALSHGRGRAVPELLRAGLDPNVADDEGDCPLHLAARSGQADALDHLLRAGADPSHRNHAGRTALDLALETPADDLRRALVERLLQAGAPVRGLKAFPSGDADLDDRLRRLGAVEHDISVRRFEEARDAAIRGDAAKLRQMLLGDPELIHARSPRPHRSTLLHYMAANGVETEVQQTPQNAPEILRILLDAGAEVDALCNSYGGGPAQTTLALLASSSHPAQAGVQGEMVRMLVEAGADPNGLDDDGVPLATAIAFRCPQAVDALAQAGARLDNLVFAAASGDLEAVKVQVDEKGRLRPQAGFCDVPWCRSLRDPERAVQQGLVHAAQFGRLPVVGYLVASGVDVNAGLEDGITALHEASFMGHIEVVRYLLQQGADPSLRERRYGSSALGWAREGKRKDILKLLLEQSQPDIIDAAEFDLPERLRELLESNPGLIHAPDGRAVPLRVAAHLGHLEVAKILLAYGADPAFKPDDGDSALELAKKSGHDGIVRLLQRGISGESAGGS
ncbi:MAG TPA: ankyrin repeat domain-containing protein [Acidobacteriota bacterium]|nr:ankyrin repeat domain-containing protein [Acidobacteriota bacterium]